MFLKGKEIDTWEKVEVCPHCGSTEIEYEGQVDRIKATCKSCGRYIKWCKYDFRTKEEKAKDAMLNKPASEKQKLYIQALASKKHRIINVNAISMFEASQLINELKA